MFDIQKCLLCEVSSYGETNIHFTFPPDVDSPSGRSPICRYCMNRTNQNWDVWVYIDEKLSDVVESPTKTSITLQDEARIRNQISRGSMVYVSDGSRVWRFGSPHQMSFKVFSKAFGPWKRLYPSMPFEEKEGALSERDLQKLQEKISL